MPFLDSFLAFLKALSPSDRINSAIGTGGASRLIATIQQNLGVRINHYVEVDFVGFRSIVEAVGGVTMYVPAPASRSRPASAAPSRPTRSGTRR